MTLDLWLKQATRHLSAESTAQVRREIGEHFGSAHETAIASGASTEEADRVALRALGDAKSANREYRKVLLTSGEARALAQSKREARLVCGHVRTVLSIPGIVLTAAGAVYLWGDAEIAQMLLAAAI